MEERVACQETVAVIHSDVTDIEKRLEELLGVSPAEVKKDRETQGLLDQLESSLSDLRDRVHSIGKRIADLHSRLG